MRLKAVLTAAAAVAALGLASPQSARAEDHGSAREPIAKHLVYYPRYRAIYYTYGQSDPFAYEADTHGYYPYYNSGDWKPKALVPLRRAHFAAPTYYSGWGANKKHWDQYAWHGEHHDRHPFWDW